MKGDAVPQANRAYPITFGDSFLNPENCGSFAILRYDFKPASVSRSKPGVIQASDGGKVSLYLANNNNEELDINFTGKQETAKDDLDALLIFDGSSFRLEQLSSQIKTRYVRDAAPYSGSNGLGERSGTPSSMDDLFPSDDVEQEEPLSQISCRRHDGGDKPGGTDNKRKAAGASAEVDAPDVAARGRGSGSRGRTAKSGGRGKAANKASQDGPSSQQQARGLNEVEDAALGAELDKEWEEEWEEEHGNENGSSAAVAAVHTAAAQSTAAVHRVLLPLNTSGSEEALLQKSTQVTPGNDVQIHSAVNSSSQQPPSNHNMKKHFSVELGGRPDFRHPTAQAESSQGEFGNKATSGVSVAMNASKTTSVHKAASSHRAAEPAVKKAPVIALEGMNDLEAAWAMNMMESESEGGEEEEEEEEDEALEEEQEEEVEVDETEVPAVDPSRMQHHSGTTQPLDEDRPSNIQMSSKTTRTAAAKEYGARNIDSPSGLTFPQVPLPPRNHQPPLSGTQPSSAAPAISLPISTQGPSSTRLQEGPCVHGYFYPAHGGKADLPVAVTQPSRIQSASGQISSNLDLVVGMTHVQEEAGIEEEEDDEDANRCSDDDSDGGIEYF
ncbi:hypothetical protein CEUSTIGMA_g5338.t1 [Chlamydomonas eustigma]|uniref:Transcription elongation factor Eaf N-terminal domain-containing protein n=1 Tax=Chlamydomonas eustigma TaxID=1157962 RepID=A0A250X4B3_9CHLO|nr:hypothetical protein CEUSTIGMA_g5338.t1 [Chlamydomonas eustigma]|eukprot:GAX77896.1 hypothetical protein CEUSTIGMA_g5338.t1 [Chlamydomonas eustigma]